jgi:hypothetical protein
VSKNDVERIAVENVNHPGSVRYVDAKRYAAVRRAFTRMLPKASPGMTADEIRERLPAHLPDELFREGAGPNWWAKTVQLDLEAKGVIEREKTRPLRFRRSR